MLSESRIIYLILYVSDLAVSRAFYEDALGFRVLEERPTSVKYSAGHVVLCLHRAADYNVTLRQGLDRSIDITFLVDDLEAMRATLEARGVRFSPTLKYSVGQTTDFYDPDGHWFSLYQTSEAAMTWPSADKIRALRAVAGMKGVGGDGASSAGNEQRAPGDGPGLDDHELVYLFLFVQDPDASLAFYHEVLGLEAVEGGPCKRVPTSAPEGVVKYDGGGTLLTTHHVEGDAEAARYRVSLEGSGGVALVFHVPDLQAAMAGLAERGVAFTQGSTASELGTVARFTDPAGHVYYLCEPSSEAWTQPSGPTIERILAASL